MKQVTSLRSWYADNLRMQKILQNVWIITDENIKEIVVKFDDAVPKTERIIRMQLIGENLMKTAAAEDEKAGGKSSFGDLMDGIRLREWKEEDEEIIKSAIPHDIKREDNNSEKEI